MRYIKYRQSLEDIFFKHPPPPFPDKFNIRNYIFIQCFIGTFFFQRPINYQLFIDSIQINKPKTLLFK